MSEDTLVVEPIPPPPPARRALRALRRPEWVTPGLLTWTRWVSITGWAVAFGRECYVFGIPYFRSDLLLWMAIGLAAASIGKRAIWTVVVDFLPLALVLLAYDYLRGISDTLGMPTWWHPQNDVDKALFGGVQPTVWLQEHLKYPTAQWWDVVATLTYVSFFFLPYLTAGVLWLRSRAEFRRWAGRFVVLSFLGFGLFALIPAAPPWAAARCPAANVAKHPSNPTCLGFDPRLVDGGMLGKVTDQRHGAHPWIERLSGRGFSELHLKFAGAVITTGQGGVDLVAAVPSLHAGGTMLFVVFFWRRSKVWVRAILASYAVLMCFALVYQAEHYVSDVLAGWLCAFAVAATFSFFERRRKRAAPPDTLDKSHAPAPTASRMEISCPPIETTPSST
ncbi:MAG: inositol phosphorylceramide synthase [Pseudonocardiales bacterium]|nr:MAG: inositol phosphorylceramide synthase [Pseudonocardiales bacterium]